MAGKWLAVALVVLLVAALAFFIVDGIRASRSRPRGSSASTEPEPSSPATGTSAEDTVTRFPEIDPTAPIDYRPALVNRVIGGDTVRLLFGDGREESARLIGVDCPESTAELPDFGDVAAEYTRRRLLAQTVYVETDTALHDSDDQLLVYLWLQVPSRIDAEELRVKLFNASLLLDGYANLMNVAPNAKYAELLASFEREAREAGVGLWSQATVASGSADNPAISSVYVADMDAGEFHLGTCGQVGRIAETNRVPYSTREKAIAAGYEPCSTCQP